jgi:hypothetical protein
MLPAGRINPATKGLRKNTSTGVIPEKAGRAVKRSAIQAFQAGCRIKSGMTPLRIKLPV